MKIKAETQQNWEKRNLIYIIYSDMTSFIAYNIYRGGSGGKQNYDALWKGGQRGLKSHDVINEEPLYSHTKWQQNLFCVKRFDDRRKAFKLVMAHTSYNSLTANIW